MSLQLVRDGLQEYQRDTLDPQARVPLGLPAVDQMLRGGLRKRQVAMVMAVSSVGKTTIGLQAVAANPTVPTLVFSIEMTWPQVTSRLTSMETGIPDWELEAALRNGQYPQAMIDTAARFPVLVGDDSSEMSVKDMKAQVEKASSMVGPIRLILIDYLELIGGAGMLGKAEQVDKTAVKVLSLAKDTGASVVLLHQVGKSDGGGGFKPLSLESGRYGGHQPMHVVLGAFAPRLNPDLKPAERDAVKNDLYVQVLKNRLTGQTNFDGIKYHLDPNTGRMTEPGQPVVRTGGYQAELSVPTTAPEDYYDPFEEPF